MTSPAFFAAAGDGFVATTDAQGGWSTETANGGAVLALLGHHLEDVPTLVPMTLARFSADLVRPIPLGERLVVDHAVLREGKKIQLVELRLSADDTLFARATALRLRDADRSGPAAPSSTTQRRPAEALTPPDALARLRPSAPGTAGFLRVVDMRHAPSSDGPRGSWVRLDGEVVAGNEVRGTARLTFPFDYANLVGMELGESSVTMINPDVNAHVLRPPEPGWIGIAGDTRVQADLGRGVSLAHLSDERGVFAVVSISQLLEPLLP